MYDKTSSEDVPLDMCAKRRLRSTCTLSRSDQNHHRALFEYPRMQSFLTPKTGLFGSSFDIHIGSDVFSLRHI